MSSRASRPVALKRLKYVVSPRRSRTDSADEARPYIGLEQIESSTGRLVATPMNLGEPPSSSAGEGESLSNTFERGDVLFCKLRPYLAKVWVAEFPGRCTTELLVMRPMAVDARFLRYVCLERGFIDRVDASTFGSKMPRADWDFIGNMLVPVPEWRRQVAIADVLDQETARLDALVRVKERVLRLLAEKRRVLITRAVTRGLDPQARLRDSDIPWLGAIPAHWEMLRLRFASPQITVGIVVTPAKYYEASGVPCLRSLNVRETGLTDSDLVYISDESNILHSKSRVYMGDLVAVRSGQPGTTSVVDRRFDGANCIDLIIIRRSPVFESEFLTYFLNSDHAKVQFVSGSGGAIQQHFNIETVGDLIAPFPPLDEQREIVGRLVAQCSQIDAIISATERSIALLKERRAAIITAAVKGQIDFGEMACKPKG